MTTSSKYMVLSFFESYARSFASFDRAAIINYYIYPCTIWHHYNYIFNENDFYHNLTLLFEEYKKLGLKKANFNVLAITQLSNNICQVQVSWILHNQQNEVVSTFEVLYTMLINDNQVKIFNVININEKI